MHSRCPEKKTKHNKKLIQINNEEKKKKLPMGMRGEMKKQTTLAPPSNPKPQMKTEKIEKTINKKVDAQPLKAGPTTTFTLEEKLMSAAAAAWGMSRNMQ